MEYLPIYAHTLYHSVCRMGGISMKAESKNTYTVALAGNPNAGKSTLFNALTGMKQHTGNWAGKTVESAKGEFSCNEKKITLIDLPGIYSLSCQSAEEQAARDFIVNEKPDAVIVVCDSTCLERGLILALEAKALGCPMILCAGLMDEAENHGISIDSEKLSELLGVPVTGISARKKKGLDVLLDTLDTVLEIGSDREAQGEAAIEDTVKQAEEIFRQCVSVPESFSDRDRRIDRFVLGKYTSIPLMLLLLGLVLWITIVGANYPSQWLQSGFGLLGTQLRTLLSGAPWWLSGILIDGIYTVLTWVVAVMLPPMAIFFPLFTLLEDCGFLPRAAFILDKSFERSGACGKQGLTMCMGLGCNAVGITGCRIIASERERLIAILTNSFVPCNGRFGTLIAIITAFFAQGTGGSLISAAVLSLLILAGIALTLIVSKLLSKIVLRGTISSFTLELPPYRRPQIVKTLVRSLLDRTVFVLGRAVVAAAPAGLLLWLLVNIRVQGASVISYMADFLDGAGRFMGMDGEILTGFILGFPANEIVLPITLMLYQSGDVLSETGEVQELYALLSANGWNCVTALCTMIFMLFHYPCATACLTIKKETGSIRWTLLAMLLPLLCGIILCSIVSCIF